MPSPPVTELMPPPQAAALTEFARTCKAAVRAVALYPGTHPAIQASLARIVTSAGRLTGDVDVTLEVHPNAIVIDARTAARPDPAIAELAALLHERLIGALRVGRRAGADDWLDLLLLLSRAPEDLAIEGGIAKAWTATGRGRFEIREIDYAEVLRERAGGESADWSGIIAHCLKGGAAQLDECMLASMIDTFGDATRLTAFIVTLHKTAARGGVSMGARAAALLQILERTLIAVGLRGRQEAEQILDTVAQAACQLTPDMMLALVAGARSAGAMQERTLSGIVTRMGDQGIASFVANSLVAERGATERLAQAFQVLVPDTEHQERLLDLAKGEAARSLLGDDSGFEDLWQSAAGMLTSYSDRNFVSEDYGRELSSARTQAIEVDSVSDDPPDRVRAWLGTVADTALRQLDLTLIYDLLRIETDPVHWRGIASVAVAELERSTALGEIADALRLTEAISADPGMLESLASGPLVRHIVTYLRKADENDVAPLNRLCHAIGPRIARPLAEALAIEENNRAIRRLRELLLGFGAAGRQSVEQLKNSSNPAVRRMAIDLLRIFGGREALPELASMLDDADPHVQRESIRAIVQIGTNEAYAVLERALVAGSASRETVLQELVSLRDDKALPLLCHVLKNTAPRGTLVDVHKQIIEAIGSLNTHPESTRTLKEVLYRGEWWAPSRTAALRSAAATALRRIGSADTRAVLEEAAARGSRGVRSAARAQLALGATRERARS